MKALGSARFLILSAAMLVALATFAPQPAEARRGIGIGLGIGAAVIGGAILNEAARAPRVRAAPAPRVYREPKPRKVVVPVERPEKYEKVEKPSRKARRGKQRQEEREVDNAKAPSTPPSNTPPQARGPDAPAGSPKESGSLTPTSSQPLPGQQDSSGKFGPHGF